MLDRTPLAQLPTPVARMDRLAEHLGRPEGSLWVKHDDLTGVAGGGNKVRKLEYLAADAMAQGCDTLVTGGAPQSNHVRLTAAVANRLGFGCVAVIAGDRPTGPSGNVVLDALLGIEAVWVGDLDYDRLEEAIEQTAERVAAEGSRRPYRIPIGGASAVGATGYVAAADELAAQVPDLGLVVVADGSGGTHAGLVAGLGDHARVLGVDAGTRADLVDAVPVMALETASAAGRPPPTGTVQLDRERIGDGYGAPTPASLEALQMAARLEGILLDPVYTGKAMAGLAAAAREGRLADDAATVFLHTGGLPALFAPRYADWIGIP